MKFHLSHRLWFRLVRLPFRKRQKPVPFVPPKPVCGQATLGHIAAGCRTMDYMGCEMLALYNVLHFLDKPRPLGQIIALYERRRWLLLGGHWGADPYAIGDYAREEGIPCTAFPGKRSFAAFAHATDDPQNRVFVLSYWVGDTVFSGAHAVTLVRREGKLWGYNLYNGQTAPLPVSDLSRLLTPERYITGFAFR